MKSGRVWTAPLLAFGLGGVAPGQEVNLFPNPGFDRFEGDLPRGWTAEIWNQPMIKERFHPLRPGRDGQGCCLEIEPTTPMTSMSLRSPAFPVTANRDYLFKGYYASTCGMVTTDKKWMKAEGVTLSGHWLDAGKETVGSFTIVLPDTQDRWIEFFQEVRSPEAGQELQIVLTRRWVGGRLRFDDFSLREGKIRDYEEEFSLRPVPDEDFFPIFGWLIPWPGILDHPAYGPDLQDLSEDHLLAEYALCNFNLGSTAKFGMRYKEGVPEDDLRLTERAKDPRFWGFQGPDEPGEGQFPELAKIRERIGRFAPSKPFWVNLLPTYGFASLEAYDHYLQAYLDTVKPAMFTYDHYCLVGNDPHLQAHSWYSPHREGDYFPNLEIVRQRALESNVEFGVIVSVGTFGPVRGASEAELRWQAFTTLAYGARSLGWFCYLTEVNYGNWTNWEDMVINRDGTRTRHYSMLKYLNGEVLAWGPTLLRLKSTGVYHTEPLPGRTRPIRESRLVESVQGGLGLVGEFRSQDGRSYLMVVNRDFNHPVTLRLRLGRSPDPLLEVSKQTGNQQAAAGYSPEKRELNVELAAGDARLFGLE